jgi:Cys-tRNA(Pro)/Cys-tRNA(Cys) deacylase
MHSNCEPKSPIDSLQALGVQFTLHTHAAIRTQNDILQITRFELESSVKTLAFSASGRRLLLAAIPGLQRISYGRLGKAAGVKRADLRSADPDQLALLGMQPGGVSPVCMLGNVTIVFDSLIPGMGKVYCGSGIENKTIELDADDMIRIAPSALIANITADPLS